jgi:WXXGXW repeat (2 copies)
MMSVRKVTLLAAPMLVALTVGSAAVPAFAQTTSTVIIAPTAPPPPRVETIPPPPSAVMTWEAGHWAWNGTTWDWTEGHYVQRPQPTAVWEPGHWAQESTGGYIWVDGHWQS